MGAQATVKTASAAVLMSLAWGCAILVGIDKDYQPVKCYWTIDCTGSDVCNSQGRCVPKECDDGDQDGAETDVDCGGGTCPGCEVGKICQRNSDCASSASCVNGKCAPTSSCKDCLGLLPPPDSRFARSGGWDAPAPTLLSSLQSSGDPEARWAVFDARCARTP
jgi:hypothetical protein